MTGKSVTDQRTASVLQILRDEDLDGFLFFGLPNIRYLCGFTGTDGALLIKSDETVFLTDSRYVTQANDQVSTDRVHCYRNKLQAIADELRDAGCRKVGFDSEVVTVGLYDELKPLADPQIQWLPVKKQLQPLRGRKTAEELVALQKAADLNKAAFEAVLPLIKPRISERQLALELEFTLKRLGGETNAFDFIVASGTRGALPHGIASNKLLNAGELVTIDFGTRVAGYHSDETVTLALGSIDRKLRQIFNIVLEAHDLALDAVRPGIHAAALDAVARDHIVAAGYGDYFGHGLGHGVGLEIHEYPTLSSRSETQLEEGMVVTIEPGIYLPDFGGVRIEDTVVVTVEGCDILTSIPKKFRQLDQ